MLSYQHGYHAGNFADVHKHSALCLCLAILSQEKSIVTYMDTHSARGLYDLTGQMASKTGEWKEGVAKLEGVDVYATALQEYQKQLSDIDKGIYPGSPKLIQNYMAQNHRGQFFELHPKEFESLQDNFADDPRINCHKRDGMKDIFNFLPNRKSKGLVLIDPSYEVKEDYEAIPLFVKKLIKRWPGATVLVWYPILKEERHSFLKTGLKEATFYEMQAPTDTQRMIATGLAILNAPEGFHDSFLKAVSEISELLK